MVSEVDIEIAEKDFDRRDYNNQKNYLWCLVDVAKAREQGREYPWENFPYAHSCHTDLAGVTPGLSSQRLTKMAMRLTEVGIGNSVGFVELIRVAGGLE